MFFAACNTYYKRQVWKSQQSLHQKLKDLELFRDSAASELCFIPGNLFLNNTVTVWYKDVLIKSYRYKNMCMIGLDAIKTLCKLKFYF